MSKALIFLGVHILWWLPALMMLSPVIWTIIYYSWYAPWKKRRHEACIARLDKFFAEHPEHGFGWAAFKVLESPQGKEMMHKIETDEYRARFGEFSI